MEFKPFPKIPRWSRDVIITEKIDGTNASLLIEQKLDDVNIPGTYCDTINGVAYRMYAGSRNRWISRESDNYGFANWAFDNGAELIAGLGEGHHFGEWWGSGIQRGYGMKRKHFSLFNVHRWIASGASVIVTPKAITPPQCCDVVPIIYAGPPDGAWERAMEVLRPRSLAALMAEGVSFDKPEGVVIFHTGGGNYLFKKTFEGDEGGKGNV